MFRDTGDELKRLEEELLAEEEIQETEEELFPEDALYPDLYEEETQPRAYITEQASMHATRKYRLVNTDRVDCDLETFSQAVEKPKKDKLLTFLTVLAILLTVGIVCVVLYWVYCIWGGYYG